MVAKRLKQGEPKSFTVLPRVLIVFSALILAISLACAIVHLVNVLLPLNYIFLKKIALLRFEYDRKQ